MIQQNQDKNFIKKLLGFKGFFFLFVLALIWLILGVGRESYRKRQLTKEINNLKSEISRIEGSNHQLGDLIEYFNQESFLEKEARLKLNLKKPGEKMVIVSGGQNAYEAAPIVLRPTDEQLDEEQFALSQEKDLSFGDESSNWWKWWEYFFKRD